jgi:large subunit ribosomal protein L4
MYHGAMQAILSELVRQDRLVVVEDFAIEAPNTKAFSAKLKELELSNVLVVVEEVDDNLYLGCRNIHNVDVIDVQGVNPVNLIGFKKVLFTVGALKKAEELFA